MQYQHPQELLEFVRFCRGKKVRRYLEIGSRWGDSFYAVMAALPRPSFGVFVDIPESSEKCRSLTEAVLDLQTMGQEIVGFFGSSRSREMREAIRKHAPFDLVFIDGDHTYRGVKADWDYYRNLAPIVALHDVSAPDNWVSDGKPNGVGRLWREIKSCGIGQITEFIVPSDRPMGYGIVQQGA